MLDGNQNWTLNTNNIDEILSSIVLNSSYIAVNSSTQTAMRQDSINGKQSRQSLRSILKKPTSKQTRFIPSRPKVRNFWTVQPSKRYISTNWKPIRWYYLLKRMTNSRTPDIFTETLWTMIVSMKNRKSWRMQNSRASLSVMWRINLRSRLIAKGWRYFDNNAILTIAPKKTLGQGR